MENKTEIVLNFNRKDFEEIYFKDKEYDFFKGTLTKRAFQNLLLSTGLFLFFIYGYFTKDSNPIVIILIGLTFLYSLINYFIKALEIYKIKRKVKEYLDHVEKIKSHKLILTHENFQLIQEDKKVIVKWTDFKTVEIKDLFIYLLSDQENYLIPKKSMTEIEFKNLKTILEKKVKLKN